MTGSAFPCAVRRQRPHVRFQGAGGTGAGPSATGAQAAFVAHLVFGLVLGRLPEESPRRAPVRAGVAAVLLALTPPPPVWKGRDGVFAEPSGGRAVHHFRMLRRQRRLEIGRPRGYTLPRVQP